LKKKKLIIIGFCIVLAALAVVLYKLSTNDHSRSDLSIHNIDWSDVSGMNEKIVAFYFSDPPFFEDEWVDAAEHLEDLLQFFGENIGYLRDRGRSNDMEVVFEFENVTGDEEFLESNELEGTFTLHFYFDRSLSSEFFELLNASRHARLVEQNPSLAQEDISLSDVNWSNLIDDYESYIYGVTLERRQRVRQRPDLQYGFDIADFNVGRDDLTTILTFLEENIDMFSDIATEEYRYIGSIFYRRFDYSEPQITARFFMNEELTRILSDEVIGEEAWNRAQR